MSTFTTRKALSRRHLLRGVGATLSLPLLEAMIPAATAANRVAPPAKRLSYIYIPMGTDHSRWNLGATRTLEDFRQRYPNHALQPEVGNKLAVAYLEKGNWAQAAGEFTNPGLVSTVESQPGPNRGQSCQAIQGTRVQVVIAQGRGEP